MYALLGSFALLQSNETTHLTFAVEYLNFPPAANQPLAPGNSQVHVARLPIHAVVGGMKAAVPYLYHTIPPSTSLGTAPFHQ